MCLIQRATALALLLIVAVHTQASAADSPLVRVKRVPDGGIQPQAVAGPDGRIHLIYYKGEHRGGDVYYVHSADGGNTFSNPVRVNSERATAVAMGGVRGAHIALGRNGGLHVAWMGARQDPPPVKKAQEPDADHRRPDHHHHAEVPMWYARLSDSGRAFEPQRNLLTVSGTFDGGGSVAADAAGNVYVAWHGVPKGTETPDETKRQVWLAISSDEGASFKTERPVTPLGEGVCACCGMRAFADAAGDLFILRRSATNFVNRDMMLTWGRAEQKLNHLKVDPWQVNSCPMSTAVIRSAPGGAAIAWETNGRVFAALLNAETGKLSPPIEPPGKARNCKHPSVALNADGQLALAWTEGMTWNRGGKVAWQVFDAAGEAIADAAGQAPGVPAFSLVTIVPQPDGTFLLLY